MCLRGPCFLYEGRHWSLMRALGDAMGCVYCLEAFAPSITFERALSLSLSSIWLGHLAIDCDIYYKKIPFCFVQA